MKYTFSDQAIIQGKNHADLGGEGDFTAEEIEYNGGQGFIAKGTYKEIGEPERETELSVNLSEYPEDEENTTAGELFNLPWDTFMID